MQFDHYITSSCRPDTPQFNCVHPLLCIPSQIFSMQHYHWQRFVGKETIQDIVMKWASCVITWHGIWHSEQGRLYVEEWIWQCSVSLCWRSRGDQWLWYQLQDPLGLLINWQTLQFLVTGMIGKALGRGAQVCSKECGLCVYLELGLGIK